MPRPENKLSKSLFEKIFGKAAHRIYGRYNQFGLEGFLERLDEISLPKFLKGITDFYTKTDDDASE